MTSYEKVRHVIAFGKLYKSVTEIAEVTKLSENEVKAEIDTLRAEGKIQVGLYNDTYLYAMLASVPKTPSL